MRLSKTTVKHVPSQVVFDDYDRDNLRVGIVHLGLGAFHRAHQAVYTDKIMALSGGDWMTVGVSLRSDLTAKKMSAQQGLYTLIEQDSDCLQARIIGSIAQVLFLEDDRAALNALWQLQSLCIISLTITEKGYCRSPSTGQLDLKNPDIVYDLAHPESPKSAIGLIVQALQYRYDNALPAITLLSCDNLADNGKALKMVVLDYAQRIDSKLALWIEQEIAFPGTMVDRIVPAVTATAKALVASHIGLRDEACVTSEAYSQWVIEDSFANARPAWEQVGAILTSDVAPYEAMKLRLLNGAHSSMAYLGFLAGMQSVADCMANKQLRAFVENLMFNEIAPMVKVPIGYDLRGYIEKLISRFCNSSLQHQCIQIAMDGSQKLPQRILVTVAERIKAGKGFSSLSLALAAWMIFVTGLDEKGKAIAVQDPLAEALKTRGLKHRYNPEKLVEALLSEERIFTLELAKNALFRASLEHSVQLLLNHGALGAIEHV